MEQFSNELQANLRSLNEFQRQFDLIEANFDEIQELNQKSKQMKALVKSIVQRYDKAEAKQKK